MGKVITDVINVEQKLSGPMTVSCNPRKDIRVGGC